MKKELTIKKEIIMTEENYNRCKNIAMELDEIAAGTVYRTDDGDTISENDFTPEELEDLEEREELESYTMYDYFSDVYDIKYTIGSDRETLYGVKLLVAFGGPNIYVDTNDGKVKLYWWNEYAEYELSEEAIKAINDCFQELYYC